VQALANGPPDGARKGCHQRVGWSSSGASSGGGAGPHSLGPALVNELLQTSSTPAATTSAETSGYPLLEHPRRQPAAERTRQSLLRGVHRGRRRKRRRGFAKTIQALDYLQSSTRPTSTARAERRPALGAGRPIVPASTRSSRSSRRPRRREDQPPAGGTASPSRWGPALTGIRHACDVLEVPTGAAARVAVYHQKYADAPPPSESPSSTTPNAPALPPLRTARHPCRSCVPRVGSGSGDTPNVLIPATSSAPTPP